MRKAAWVVVFSLLAAGEEWTRFRGPNGSGVADAHGLPSAFGPGKNEVWKTAVPFGRSSPILSQGRVFLTASEDGKLLTLAYDARTGKELWRRSIEPERMGKLFRANDAASPTPASDGKNLYVFFADFGLISYTHDGKERWRHRMGPFVNFYGIGSSPVVSGGLVVMLCDQIRGSYAEAVDAATGKVKWHRERPEAPDGWGVPIVHGDTIVMVGSNRVDGYYVATGEPKWWMPLMSMGSMGSPVIAGDTLLVKASGEDQPWLPAFPGVLEKLDKDKNGTLSKDEAKDEKDWAEHFGWVDLNKDGELTAAEWEEARQYGVGNYGAVAIPLNGKGEIAASAVRWRVKRNLPYVPAPVLYDGVYYMVKDGGIISSLNPATGEFYKQGRSTGALGEYMASPVAADGKVFAVNTEGKMTVLKAGPQWEVLGVNDLGDEAFATPAITSNRIFVRTRQWLFAFGEPGK